MPAPITRILLCFTLCLALVSFWGCQTCREFDDVASVEISRLTYPDKDIHIDSVVVRAKDSANDSITGCSNPRYEWRVGSKTHHIQFPINARIQLFSQGDLWKEFFLEINKNTVLKVYSGYDCSSGSSSPYTFLNRVASAKKSNRFIDSSLTDDYCWLLEKMDNSYDSMRCIELSVGGEQDLCYWL